ncbi:DUF4148 domain-containing protein [Caballeronia sp. LZ062]|uniref:DUF4148 domain-containing protein n=1 Tax=unclassified Caballeronia TaxID=2646786 RepID=UPI002857A3D7|nr:MULTISPECIES: DUF4148 domain-containing protein [unclassified Caballeronia]MDR5855760.1 DUF4148 domain-containing protein [Caballeronia sp. LZ050]MDR5872453.1 DUF4148 domain-containing protein [Caballeronia sp. LZ062]
MNAGKFAAALAIAGVSMGMISQSATAQGKTREQVRQELVQARHEGIIPANKTQYPPSHATIARNQATHAAETHGGEKSPSPDQHDQLAAR